jgi:hypothetical protein
VNPPFLPIQDEERICLVLDLDETLVHFFYVNKLIFYKSNIYLLYIIFYVNLNINQVNKKFFLKLFNPKDTIWRNFPSPPRSNRISKKIKPTL